jgi:hypothetical protein
LSASRRSIKRVTKWIIASLAEESQKYPKLFSVIMFHTYSGSQEDGDLSSDVGPHTFTKRVRSDGAIEQSLIIRNVAYGRTISVAIQKKFRRAFVPDL